MLVLPAQSLAKQIVLYRKKSGKQDGPIGKDTHKEHKPDGLGLIPRNERTGLKQWSWELIVTLWHVHTITAAAAATITMIIISKQSFSFKRIINQILYHITVTSALGIMGGKRIRSSRLALAI